MSFKGGSGTKAGSFTVFRRFEAVSNSLSSSDVLRYLFTFFVAIPKSSVINRATIPFGKLNPMMEELRHYE
jgi:hypothetical protein